MTYYQYWLLQEQAAQAEIDEREEHVYLPSTDQDNFDEEYTYHG